MLSTVLWTQTGSKNALTLQGRSHQNLSGQVEITGFNLWCL